MARKLGQAANKPAAILRIALVCAGAAGVVLCLIFVRKLSSDAVRDDDRFTISFGEIACTPPPEYIQIGTFLTEVQYVSGYPDRVRVLEDNLPTRLADAFRRHPWVERVERVEILPGRQVTVALTYRVPVLAVVTNRSFPEIGAGHQTRSGRAVDSHGVLLPATAPPAGLPILAGEFSEPRGGAGTLWSDAVVRSAARIAAYLTPHQDRLRLYVFENHGSEFVLKTVAGSRVVWGRGVGQEGAEEALAAEKLDRLLRYCLHNGSLDGPECCYEHNVRERARFSHERIVPQ